jgi:hypothetical protein
MEWIAGVRCDDGMLQFIPNNNAALSTARFDDAYSSGSDRYWKSLDPIRGTIVDPRSTAYNKIYFDGSYNADDTEATDGYGAMRFNTSVLHPDDGGINVGSAYSYFTQLGFNSSITPDENSIKLLKQMALLPMGSGVQQGRCYSRVPRVNNVPRMLGRGGAYYYENPYENQDKDPFVGLFAYSVANLADAQGYPMSFRVCSYA